MCARIGSSQGVPAADLHLGWEQGGLFPTQHVVSAAGAEWPGWG